MYAYVWIGFVLGIFMVIWFVTGGLRDLRRLFRDLTLLKRNEIDDGRVNNPQNEID